MKYFQIFPSRVKNCRCHHEVLLITQNLQHFALDFPDNLYFPLPRRGPGGGESSFIFGKLSVLLSLMTDFDDFLARCMACEKCVLRKGASRVVPGVGNPHAKIMFIGEAPGKQEDIQGEPFVGAAGKFLNEMLESIGLARKDIYIANTIKCRPPENRDPLPEEIETCKPWLKEQILLIQPKVIVTLGRFAMNLFLPDAKISSAHGKPEKVGKLIVVPLYHPAAALYNGGMRETLKNDFQILKNYL